MRHVTTGPAFEGNPQDRHTTVGNDCWHEETLSLTLGLDFRALIQSEIWGEQVDSFCGNEVGHCG